MVLPPAGKEFSCYEHPNRATRPRSDRLEAARSQSCRELAPKGESPGKSTGANPQGLENKSLWSFALLSQQRRGVLSTEGRHLKGLSHVFEARAEDVQPL